MGWVVQLQIPPRSDHLALVRTVVEGAARIGGSLPDRRLDDLRLAVSEACANAFDAQVETSSDAAILVSIELDDDTIAVTVTDHAGGFAVEDVDPIPAATDPGRLRHERGLGIPLMRSLVDELTFTPTGDGTTVRLVVRS
jgi:anti-sigma regulatory factor (Ser/Thr protein kinase)